MQKIIATILLCVCASAATVHQRKPRELREMGQLARLSTSNLQGDFRVIFSLDEPLVITQEFTRLPTWMVTVERFPADDPNRATRYVSLLFADPPPCATKDSCAVQEIHGEVVYRGRCILSSNGTLASFSGSQESTRPKLLAFTSQLKAHPEWTKADMAAALASGAAKYGPDKKKDFMATLPLKPLEGIFGPLRVERIAQIQPGQPWAGYWRVRLKPLQDPSARVEMSFEPFEGQLQQLFVLRPHKVLDPKTKTYKWVLPDW